MKYIVTLLSTIVFTLVVQGKESDRPNIVFFFIGDWAWNGTPIAMDDDMPNSRMPIVNMPNLKKLASEGMKFRNAYASPQCSPSRVCVQTGQTSARNGFTVYSNSLGQKYYNEKKSKGLPVISCIADQTIRPDAVTIPEALKPLGYVSAHIGKWHMRGDPSDEGYVLHDGDTNNDPGNTIVTRSEDGKKLSKLSRIPNDLTDPKLMFSITQKSNQFIEDQVKANQPFYLQISHYAMHAGSECLPATREKYAKHPAIQAYYKKVGKTADKISVNSDPAIWYGMAEDLDTCIGKVLDKLEALDVADKTYIVLMSDNGYRHKELVVSPQLKQPLHAHKWWVWQGGIRVPMLVKGPDIKAGSTFEANVVNYDLLPTFVDWAGGDSATLQDIDGVSLSRFLRGKKPGSPFRNRNLYFHYPHNRTSMPHSAVVSGTKKVIHFYEKPGLPMMFDLATDEAEVHNVAPQFESEHQQLHKEMMRYLKSVNARIPKINPDFDPKVYQATKEYEQRVKWGPFKGTRELEEDEG